ncbi:Conserved_hypothetical protein [Hexamita inflata]|uniref:Uncharacterized protein n=1 Tax=Hexamita inflata TaxID=28002 RepID=A0AA86QIX3_9EUKA|nr:Conserved hypothetical protein [Hexamita inflata]
MPSSKINTEEALLMIAQQLAKQNGISALKLIDNHKLLDQQLIASFKFDWEAVSEQLGTTKAQVYRWYFDTHQRNLYGNVNQEDMATIRKEVKKAVAKGQDLGLPFQKDLKSKLSQVYHRNSFTVAFNNCKRLIIMDFQKNSVHSASNDTNSISDHSSELAKEPVKEEKIDNLSFIAHSPFEEVAPNDFFFDFFNLVFE